MNRPQLAEQTRANLNTVATWAGALAFFGLLMGAVIVVVVRGIDAWKLTEVLIWVIYGIWMLVLTGVALGHSERIDAKDDTADRAIGMVQNHTHADADTDTIPVVVHDLPRRRPRPHPVDEEWRDRFTFKEAE